MPQIKRTKPSKRKAVVHKVNKGDYYDPELSDEDNAELNQIMDTLDQDEKFLFADVCDELIKIFPNN